MNKSIISWLFRFLIFFGILGMILFGSAGRIDWLPAWFLIVLYAIYLILVYLWSLRNAPELMRERGHIASNVKTWDKVINIVYTILLVLLLIISGLDAGRYHWSSTSIWLQMLGIIGMGASGLVIWWVIATNAFASRWARIQDDRGQVVISKGPYRFVRHPMYSAIIVLCLCIPIELGSWWGLIPGGCVGVLYMLRTKLEDDMLQDELQDYREYAQKVRYRLLPGVW